MLAVAGGKGGCGKTTTTLGLALAAGRRGRSALAVDADVDVPDLHRLAGADEPDEGAPETTRAVPGEPGVRILPAGPGWGADDLHRRLAAAGDPGRVLLDCPAGAGRDAAVPLRAADRTLVVTTAERASLRDAAKTVAMSRAVGMPVVGAVLTRADRAPDGVAALLDTALVEPVPETEQPLQAAGVRRRHERVLRRLRAERP